MAVQVGPHDAQDGDDEQDGEGRVRADEGGGEDRSHDMEGGRTLMLNGGWELYWQQRHVLPLAAV